MFSNISIKISFIVQVYINLPICTLGIFTFIQILLKNYSFLIPLNVCYMPIIHDWAIEIRFYRYCEFFFKPVLPLFFLEHDLFPETNPQNFLRATSICCSSSTNLNCALTLLIYC